MKQISKALILCSLLTSLGLAYSVNGDIKLEYTGYKLVKKLELKERFQI